MNALEDTAVVVVMLLDGMVAMVVMGEDILWCAVVVCGDGGNLLLLLCTRGLLLERLEGFDHHATATEETSGGETVKEGREGRTDGRKGHPRKEGGTQMEGMKEGRTQKEGREGRKEGREEGRMGGNTMRWEHNGRRKEGQKDTWRAS